MIADLAAMTDEELNQELLAARKQLADAGQMNDDVSYQSMTQSAQRRIADATGELQRRGVQGC